MEKLGLGLFEVIENGIFDRTHPTTYQAAIVSTALSSFTFT